MYNYIVTVEANDDVERITEYVANELDNRQASERIRNDIFKGFVFVGDNPYAGRQIRIAKFKARRWIVRKKYLIYYEIDKTGKVIILRVTDAQQNQKRLLT